MKRILLLTVVTLSLFSFSHKPATSSWKLVYINTFTDLNGNDITAKMAPYFGKPNDYFINDNNYKAYNENNKLMYLYNSSTNVYYSVINHAAEKIDAAQATPEKPRVRKLSEKVTIAGYQCSGIEMETSSSTSVYYFTPAIAINKAAYAKHNFGDWNAYLEASNGAVPLKMIQTDKKMGFKWTSVAAQAIKVNLPGTDFELPPGVMLK